MSRRTTPTATRDDNHFPIRVKVPIPPNGLGARRNEIQDWLKANVVAGQWANHATTRIGGSALAVYFERIEDAAQFCEAFTDLLQATR